MVRLVGLAPTRLFSLGVDYETLEKPIGTNDRSKMSTSQRALDILGGTGGLLVLSPLLVAIAVWIRLDSAGPIFYWGPRVGRAGVVFGILKFRTMVTEAAAQGAGITTRNDPRITRAGRVLRRYKLDELPQLWNVVRGEMSLVGPRPEDPRYVKLYTPAQRAVLDVPPGITSAASLQFRQEEALLHGANWEQTYTQVVMPKKLELELGYLRHRTFWSDLEILGRTCLSVFLKEGDTHVA